MDNSKLLKYAEAIVKVGARVEKGQEVFIDCSCENEDFCSLVVEECYKAGAKRVFVDFHSPKTSRHNFKYADTETLSKVPSFLIDKWKYKAQCDLVIIWIDDDDPDELAGLDAEKVMKVSMENRLAVRPIRKEMENKYQWCIAAAPCKAWAHKLFPELNVEEAVDKLWDSIIKCARCDGDNPINDWDNHNNFLKDKCAWLNEMDIDYLEYKSSNGTDFKVSLHKETNFVAGKSISLKGRFYNPNMPSEECFISPVKESANGLVYASKPLSLSGNVLTDFGFKFENGNVVEVLAKDNITKQMLEDLIKTDEGAKRLGEVALVPFNSPVNETGILFYNTLFDENACCHLALGVGFEDTIRNFDKLSREEIDKVGINESAIHVDFMIGTSDLEIVATLRDGSKKQIFKNGTWA